MPTRAKHQSKETSLHHQQLQGAGVTQTGRWQQHTTKTKTEVHISHRSTHTTKNTTANGHKGNKTTFLTKAVTTTHNPFTNQTQQQKH